MPSWSVSGGGAPPASTGYAAPLRPIAPVPWLTSAITCASSVSRLGLIAPTPAVSTCCRLAVGVVTTAGAANAVVARYIDSLAGV